MGREGRGGMGRGGMGRGLIRASIRSPYFLADLYAHVSVLLETDRQRDSWAGRTNERVT